jgi:hypothetical protein
MFLEAFKYLFSPVTFVAELITDRTKLLCLWPRGEGASAADAHVEDQGGKGLFYFAITTDSYQEIEMKSVLITCCAPLTLSDADGSGFFANCRSPKLDEPFAVSWKGEFTLDRNHVVPFGLRATFGNSLQASVVTLHTQARRLPKLFGFQIPGRLHTSERKVTLRLLRTRTTGFETERLCDFVQPFMKNAFAGSTGLVAVHYRDEHGLNRSKLVQPSISNEPTERAEDP